MGWSRSPNFLKPWNPTKNEDSASLLKTGLKYTQNPFVTSHDVTGADIITKGNK